MKTLNSNLFAHVKELQKVAVATLTLLIILFSNINSYSQVLDTTFGVNGIVTMPNVYIPEIHLLDFDNNGDIIAVGCSKGLHPSDPIYTHIIKMNMNGVIDSSFGNGGCVTMKNDLSEMPIGLKSTNGNKILLFSLFIETNNPSEIDHKLSFLQFNSDGTPDINFGNNGEIVINISTILMIHLNNHLLYYCSLNVENDNFLFLSKKNSIYKYDYQGNIDTSFGTNGSTVLANNNIIPMEIKILSDQSIIVAGIDSILNEITVCKLTPNGEINTNFATNGIYQTNIFQNISSGQYAIKIIEENNGNLVLIGGYDISNRFFMYRLLPNGTVDATFGNNGFYLSDSVTGNNTINNTVPFLLQNGNKFICGSYPNSNVLRFNNDGTIDSTFGNNGVCLFNNFYFSDMKFQTSNKIVLGGYTHPNNNSYKSFALTRLIIDTIPPKTYSISGNITFNGSPFANVTIDTITTLTNIKSAILTDENGYYEINDIPENRSLTITPTLTGYKFDPPSYTFTATSNKTVDFIAEEELGINNYQLGIDYYELQIYPNPVKNNLNFSSETIAEITDMQGRVLLRTDKAVKYVNISNLQAGIYFVKVTLSNQNVEMIKIVKL